MPHSDVSSTVGFIEDRVQTSANAYLSNRVCSWRLSVPRDYTAAPYFDGLTLRFTKFNLSGGNGDRVESANGVALAVPADIPTLVLQPLTRSQPVWLAGTRDGKPQDWLYLNAGACPG